VGKDKNKIILWVDINQKKAWNAGREEWLLKEKKTTRKKKLVIRKKNAKREKWK